MTCRAASAKEARRVARQWDDVPRVPDLDGLSHRQRVLFQVRCVRRVLPLARSTGVGWVTFIEHPLAVAAEHAAGVIQTKAFLLKAAEKLDAVGAPPGANPVGLAIANALSYTLVQAAADAELTENRGLRLTEDEEDGYPAHDAAVLAVVSAADRAGFQICDDVWRDLSRLIAVVKYENT